MIYSGVEAAGGRFISEGRACVLFPLLAIDSLVCTGDLISVYSCDSNYSFPLQVKCISYHYTLYCNLRGYANYFPYQTTTDVISPLSLSSFFPLPLSLTSLSPPLSSNLSPRLSFPHVLSTFPPPIHLVRKYPAHSSAHLIWPSDRTVMRIIDHCDLF